MFGLNARLRSLKPLFVMVQYLKTSILLIIIVSDRLYFISHFFLYSKAEIIFQFYIVKQNSIKEPSVYISLLAVVQRKPLQDEPKIRSLMQYACLLSH